MKAPAGTDKPRAGHSFVTATVTALNDFADLMQMAEKSLTDDGVIDEDEAKKLRKNWDRLKGRLEHFIVSCEEGAYDLNRDQDEEDDKKKKKSKRGKGEEE